MSAKNDILENRRILIIDDNRMIHDDFRKILAPNTSDNEMDEDEAKLMGLEQPSASAPTFQLSFAAQGQDGAQLVKEGKDAHAPIAMAFVDMRMPPGWDGLETIENIWKHDDRVQIAICTAYSDRSSEELVQRFRHSDQILFLKKPFDNIEIIQIACTLVNKWNLSEKLNMQMSKLHTTLKARERELLETYERQKVTEAKFHQSQKMEAIGRLTGGVAHDFNNLLTVILGNIEILMGGKNALDEKCMKRLDAIRKSSQSAAKLTQQLLAFSRQQVVAFELINLNDLIENHLAKLIERIVGEAFPIKMQLDPNLPAIIADAGQIEQVLMNLVVNARDAMEKTGGMLEIKTSTGKNATSDETVVCTIKDYGEGMSQETQDKIFEPFFTTKESGKGTGIGLANAYGIIAKHSGQISVKSELTKGTTFTLTFPAQKGKAAKPAVTEQEATHEGGNETILLVEDEPDLRLLAKEILSGAGYDVVAAENGLEAYIYCMSHQPNLSLLLTDVIMPNMGGKELAERISNMMPKTPILFMSGYTGEIPLLAESENEFLQKPFSPNQLLQKVRTVLNTQ